MGSKKFKVNRLSAYVYLDFDLNSKLQINHHCDNSVCFNPDHLYIGTQKENIRDSIDHGNHSPPPRNCKLTEYEAKLIKKLYSKGNISQRKLANKFNISQSIISNIITGKLWI